jgi:DNA-binding transcriptional ArsR family regulator/YHS domain-containing protein
MYNRIFELHSELLKALAHPRRLEIIQLLRDQEMCVTDIHSMLDLPQANISQHLMLMRDAGVVASRREGKQVYYKIAHSNFIEACDLVREILIEREEDQELRDSLNFSIKDLVPFVHDPVCGMRLSPKTTSYHATHANRNYYFCASGCLKKFQESPENYVK